MLLTICPGCSAQFKVLPEQLNVRQGRVMCGRCRHVFNAFQSLSRVEEPIEEDAEFLQESTEESTDRAEHAPEAPPPIPAPESPSEAVPDHLFLRQEPLPLPAGFSSAESLPASTIPPALPVPSLKADTVGSSSVEQAADGDSNDRAQESGAAASPPAIDLTADANPLLVGVTTPRYPAPRAVARGWGFGAFILLIALLLQAAYTFRSTLIANFPALRPTAMRACESLGCTVSWGRDESALKIDASELIEAPGKAGRILLTAVLVNRAKTKQDLPSLELRLTDNANQIVASRLL
ncbi:MAG: zinc-ribbon and DUF3426 domain-containing protein, partial [Usitatibacteraceae bacterium]